MKTCQLLKYKKNVSVMLRESMTWAGAADRSPLSAIESAIVAPMIMIEKSATLVVSTLEREETLNFPFAKL